MLSRLASYILHVMVDKIMVTIADCQVHKWGYDNYNVRMSHTILGIAYLQLSLLPI